DWRKSIPELAIKLKGASRNRFGDEDFHIVAHSMGGLIARIMLRDNPEIQGDGKFVMLGTPNHGSWLAVHGLTSDLGAAAFVRSVIGIPIPPTPALTVGRTWPSAYQLLPCPSRDPRVLPTYDTPPAGVSTKHLAAARQLHAELDNIPGTDAMVY